MLCLGRSTTLILQDVHVRSVSHFSSSWTPSPTMTCVLTQCSMATTAPNLRHNPHRVTTSLPLVLYEGQTAHISLFMTQKNRSKIFYSSFKTSSITHSTPSVEATAFLDATPDNPLLAQSCDDRGWNHDNSIRSLIWLTRVVLPVCRPAEENHARQTNKKKNCEVCRLSELESELRPASARLAAGTNHVIVMWHQHEHSDLHNSTSTVIRHQCKHAELNDTMSRPVGPVMLIAWDLLPHKPVGFWCSA